MVMAVTVQAEVTVYPPLPGNRYASDSYTLNVRQETTQSSYVYQSNVDTIENSKWALSRLGKSNHWTSFSFDGIVTVEVILPAGAVPSSATVYPLRKGVSATTAGNVVTLNIGEPGQYYVEIPGYEGKPLFIFANPPEEDTPRNGQPGVLYFGPGYHDVGKTQLASLPEGATVYIAGGAYVRGLLGSSAGNITIRGRGILSGIGWPRPREWTNHMIRLSGKAGGNRIEGIVLTDGPKANIISSSTTLIENVKIFGWHHNNDGITVGPNSVIRNCFLKVNDDAIKLYYSGIQAYDNVIWMQLAGAAFQLSWNLSRQVSGTHVSRTDFIGFDRPAASIDHWHNNAVIGCRNLNGGAVSGIVFEDFHFDKRPWQLFGVKIKDGLAGYTAGQGSIDGLVFRNFHVPDAPLTKSCFDGNGNATGEIKNLTFENIRIGTTCLTEGNAQDYIEWRGMADRGSFTFSQSGHRRADEGN
ncbi:MAG: hypothetical protein K9N49_04955 [Candidatus Marinimicrobia bacterium]|nr:hypothetical protein [Candidatus Neomarinimicrobiota bacterium]